MWPVAFAASTALVRPPGRLILSTLLLIPNLIQCGAQEAGARELGESSELMLQDAVDPASCALDTAAVVEETTDDESIFDSIVQDAQGALGAVRRKKDAAATVVAEVAPERPAILATAGSATLRLIEAAREKGSDVSDAIVGAGSTAWAALNDSELVALLNSTVHWEAYEEVLAEHPEMKRTAGPVIEFATGLSPNGDIATRDIAINAALLALPAGRLGSVLGKGGKQAVKVGPDVLILVDDVVVAQIKGGSGIVVGAVEGSIDDLGRVVVRSSPPLRQVLLNQVPVHAQRLIATLLRRLRSGGTPESGAEFENPGTLLPDKPPGYYREYLLESPDSPNTGMERIVLGANGEVYFTEDCGNSYMEISPADSWPDDDSPDETAPNT